MKKTDEQLNKIVEIVKNQGNKEHPFFQYDDDKMRRERDLANLFVILIIIMLLLLGIFIVGCLELFQ